MKKYIVIILIFAFAALNGVSQQCVVTAPAAASSWVGGTIMPIHWNTAAFSGNVNLSLFDASIGPNGTVVVIIASGIPNTGTYNFLVPNTLPVRCTYGVYVENVIRTNWCYGPSNVCISQAAAPAVCCPKFSLQPDFEPCSTSCNKNPGPLGINVNPVPGSDPALIIACKNITHTYTVFPNLPIYTYTWTVIGGTPTSFTGNPIAITWGNSSMGFIQVIIKNADSSCRDTIRRKVCLEDGPLASFTFAPNPVCLAPSLVQFTNTSVGGSSYYWDFGDGSSSTLQNPTHAYTTPGNYTVVLTVSTATGSSGAVGQGRDCKCRDTASAIITVSKLKGIDIHTDDCRKMLCSGDTVKYCTSTTGCTGLNWVVNGGTIINGQGTTCITVIWNLPSTYPTTVTLNATCPNTCGNSATLFVPVLYPNLPIQGPVSVCSGATTNYSLPVLPGTFYKWTLSGGGNILGADSNINFINVNWTAATGSFTITCTYTNPYSKCSGTSSLTVTIKPVFAITGPAQSCTGLSSSFAVVGPGNANWTVAPLTGYSPAGPFPNVASISLTWSLLGIYVINAQPTIPANYCTTSATSIILVNPTPVVNPIVGPAGPVCPNQLYNYSASSNVAGGQFTWILTGGGTISPYGPNNSLASVIFTGTGPWTLQVTQTVNNCISIPVTLGPITIVPVPPAITITPPGGTCSGGTITASVTGTVPSGGYTWSSTPGAVLLTGQGTTTATFTVNSGATITITSCGGSSSIPVSITPATVTITQAAGPCSAILTATASPAGVYNWFLNGNPVGTGNPKTVNQNGTYVVQVVSAGGCIATNQIIVTGITPVNANITATGSLCNGGSVTLQVGIPANCPMPTYQWKNNNINIVGAGCCGTTLTTTTPGNYSVVITCNGNGCTATSNIITVSPCSTGPCPTCPPCINDLVISPSNPSCPNPVTLTTNIPAGCTPASTSWNYGDNTSDGTGIHQYTNVGTYTVFAVMSCSNNSTLHCGTTTVTIPMVDSFTYVVSCNGATGWSVQLQDASIYINSYSGYTRTWSTSPCGTLSSTVIANPILTIPFGCNPTVTLVILKNGCQLTKSFTFNFPTTPLAINMVPASPVCKDAIIIFNSSYTTGIISYNWTFGDIPTTTGVTNPISHVFTGTPNNPTISLAIKDQFGCIYPAQLQINVITPRVLTVTASNICPDCLPMQTFTTSPAGFTGYQWYHDGVAINGAINPTYQPCTFNASGNYYVTANDPPNNCPVTSNTVQVTYLPKPVADIQGQTVHCGSGTGPYNIYLQNAGGNNPNYTYNWTVTGPPTITFNGAANLYNVSVSVTQFGTYQFILTVTDITTGCMAKDTFCVILYQSPSVTVSGPTGNLCEGTPYTFTATALPANPNYIYQWSNGVTGPVMTTSQAGMYYVTVTDPVSGCNSGAVFAGTINSKPNVSLFPLGCDTLCDTVKLIPPLPLGPGQTYPSQYTIKWYVDGSYNSTGPVLILGLLTPIPGQHQIYIVVTDNLTGCTSTSGKFDVYIKHCGECDCKGSKWGEISLTKGDIPNANVVIGNPLFIKCNNNYTLDCRQPYVINASYFCKDSSCKGKVTYALQPPVGTVITGNVGATFTPNQSGVYILTLYGWCGNKKCDSCTIDLTVHCDTCDCKGSHWGAIIQTPPAAGLKLACKSLHNKLDCNKPYTFNASYICKDSACLGKVTYSVQPPSGSAITGTMPVTFTPTLNGTYTMTLYGWCGDKFCDTCVIKFDVKCDTTCDCKGSHWGEITVTYSGKINQIDCNKEYPWKCKVPFTINAAFNCSKPECPGTVSYILTPPSGSPITGNVLPLTYTPILSGTYTLVLNGMCGNTVCSTCVIKFHVDCPIDSNCCKHDIKVQAGNVTYTPATNSTIAGQTFTINGLSGVSLTEVRAEVISYDLSSNYKNECLGCKTFPFTWASINSANNIGAVPPKITLFNGNTTTLFNPTGTDVYKNPREVIWNNGNAFVISGPLGINFILPPQPVIDCCELNGKICVKFTFRDDKCMECEAIICFDVVIKKK